MIRCERDKKVYHIENTNNQTYQYIRPRRELLYYIQLVIRLCVGLIAPCRCTTPNHRSHQILVTLDVISDILADLSKASRSPGKEFKMAFKTTWTEPITVFALSDAGGQRLTLNYHLLMEHCIHGICTLGTRKSLGSATQLKTLFMCGCPHRGIVHFHLRTNDYTVGYLQQRSNGYALKLIISSQASYVDDVLHDLQRGHFITGVCTPENLAP